MIDMKWMTPELMERAALNRLIQWLSNRPKTSAPTAPDKGADKKCGVPR